MKFFWKPKQSPILIRSPQAIAPLSKLFLENSFTVFENPYHAISVKVLIRALMDRKNVPLKKKYFAHYVAEARVLAVFSTTNHSGGLGSAGLVNSEVIAVSFQNGVRDLRAREKYLQDCAIGAREIAFGFEEEELKWFHEPLELEPLVYVTGSLKSNLVAIENETPSTLGVVFISQWRPHGDSGLDNDVQTLLPHLLSWCEVAGYSLNVLGATTETLREKSFYDEILSSDTYVFLGRDTVDWTAGYKAVDRAELVVSIYSSLGIEAIARGKKTLFFSTPQGSRGFRVFSPVVASCSTGPFWDHSGDPTSAKALFFETLKQTESDYFEAIEKGNLLRFGSDEGLFETRNILLRLIPRLRPWVKDVNKPVFYVE